MAQLVKTIGEFVVEFLCLFAQTPIKLAEKAETLF